jgi:hypothetical protein
MRNNAYFFSKTAYLRLLVMLCSLLLSFHVMGKDYYAIPDGAGDKDGSSWENAIPGEDIENFINTVMTGGDKLLLDDDGEYFNDLRITISNSGTSGNRMTIEGVDMGDGYPLVNGPGPDAGIFIYLNAGVSHWNIKNLNIEDYKYVIDCKEAVNDPNEYFTIDGLDIHNVLDGLYMRDFRNSTIKNCEITYHRKRGIRLNTGCRDLEIMDCFTDHNMGDFGDFPSDMFPIGFEVGKGRKDTDSLDQTNITFVRCEARNNVDDDQDYWNGDGFCVNANWHNIEFYDCIAYGNADGGWDNKGVDVYFENCIAVHNKRNFRTWHSATFVNCLAANPYSHEGKWEVNYWLDGKYGDAVVDMYNCTSHNGSIDSDGNFVKINYAENCIFSASSGDSRVASGSNNIFTDEAGDPDYESASDDYEGYPLDAYNSQTYGPGQGYWYTEGEKPVISAISVNPDSGDTPLDVIFNVSATDPDGADSLLTYSWIINDGKIGDKDEFSYTFNIPGDYEVIANVRDEDFLSFSDTIDVNVTGNYPPEVRFTDPFNGQTFFVDQAIDIKVDASDRDGTVDSVLFYRDNNYLLTDTSSPFEHTVPGLSEGMYTIQARAYDDDTVYVEDSVSIEVIVPITLLEKSWDGYVDLYWEDHLSSAPNDFGELAGYNVYRSPEAGEEYSKLNSSIIDNTVFRDITARNGTSYYYVVTAENTEGNESGYSNEVAAMPQLSLNLECIDDAFVRDGKYADDNFGTEDHLIIKNSPKDWQRFSYIKFDLSSIGSLSKAALRVKSTDYGAYFHSVECYLAYNDSWTEETITWNNKPDTNSLIDITKFAGPLSWIEFDITSEVKAEVSKDSMITLVLLKVEGGNPGCAFHSKEAAKEKTRPMLSIVPEDTSSFTISASAGEGGIIEPGGNISVFAGFNQSFTISPDSRYSIEEVVVDDVSQGSVSDYTFTDVSADHAINATFAPLPTYTITTSAGTGGSISPDAETTVYEGDSLKFIITPESGFEIDSVLVDGSFVGAVNSYEFTGITANHSIEAVFTRLTSIKDMTAGSHSILYPNPAKHQFTISTINNKNADIEIYDMKGDFIKAFRNMDGDRTIPVMEIGGSGMYIIKIIADDGTGVKKLIVL